MAIITRDKDLLDRAKQYAELYSLRIHDQLGGGVQGAVFSTQLPSAIKVFKMEQHYQQEVAVYHRLKERKITEICGFSVPKPIRGNNRLWVLEMEIVRPPFVLDFASAGVDRRLNEYSPEIMEEWEESRKEIFEDRWPIVLKVISAFRSHGIYLSDVKPGNIMFAD